MKQLKKFIKESLLSDEQEMLDNIDYIKDWIYDHLSDSKSKSYIKNIELKNNKVNIDGDLLMDFSGVPELPFNFGVINGRFDITRIQDGLTSLKGFPEKITDGFTLDANNLNDLQGFPKEVGGWCIIYGGGLKSFKGLENSIFKNRLYIRNANYVTNLEGLPRKVAGEFEIRNAYRLTDAKGMPAEIGDSIIIIGCPMLKSIPNFSIKRADHTEPHQVIISSCKSLESIGDFNNVEEPEELGILIDTCRKLTSIGKMPEKCKSITIDKVGIKHLPELPQHVLKNAKISCPNIVSVEGLPKNIGGELNMKGCSDLPQEEIDRISELSSYKRLKI